MKNRINLYGPEFRPRRQWASLSQMMLAWGGVLLLLLGVAAYLGWQQSALDARQLALESELGQLRAESARLDAELARRQPSAALSAELTALREQVSGMELMLQQLGVLAPERGQSHALLLRELAGLSASGLALERIRVEGDRITLGGETRSSEEVPAWVARFGETRTLAGKAFPEFLLSRDPKGRLLFQLGSLPKETP
ncbi:MSHA biogenesis protein MshI [Aeromonas schubertii]|uniref:MSHA biogenesis protein MshI n=1 Tax=Aeromonas schubertii TaxID=652 RepID=UPI0010A7C865|nr:MSHA biogenesis protein MshI [Aeromonas schubertii]MBZ6074117.1 MSHA biogenesis protein MshI [Aeromonas schubertii]QCG49366.1 MSHA biogenesis protein MshI [Aeromonas schubertii]